MIYEYKCLECGNIQEVWQKMSDPAPRTCPSCSAQDKMERIISASSFALKGSGWYTTDYKRASSPAKSENGACPAVDSSKVDSSKTDAPAACPMAANCPSASGAQA